MVRAPERLAIFGDSPVLPVLIFHALDFVVAEARRRERQPRFMRARWFASAIEQVIVRVSNRLQMTLLASAGMRRAPLEAKDFKTSTGQLIAQMNTKFSGGEIREPTT